MYRYNRRLLIQLATGVTLLFWASAFSGIRVALRDYSPGELGALRFIVASAALLLFVLWRGIPRLRIEDVPGLGLAGGLGITAHQMFLITGEVTVTAGSASLVANLIPVFTAILAAIFLAERLALQGWLGVGLSLFGVALIAMGDAEGVAFDTGILLVLAAALARAVSFIVQKRYLPRYGALGFTTYSVWAGTVFLLPFAPDLPASVLEASAGATAAVVYLGLFPAAFGYLVWALILDGTSASRAASVLFLVPVLSIGVAWAWLGETPGLITLVGGTLSLVGVTWVRSNGEEFTVLGRRIRRAVVACCPPRIRARTSN